MSVTAITKTPKGLLAAIKKAIDEKHITTWSYDSDGDFTHTPPQWKNKAWMRPREPEDGKIKFSILGPKGVKLPREVYAVYHGRFIEMIAAHFELKFSAIVATASQDVEDNFTPE